MFELERRRNGGVGILGGCTSCFKFMVWFFLLLTAVLVAAGLSLAASRHTRRDLASGRPTFESVADATGIWNRAQLEVLVGAPDDDDRYEVSAETVLNIRASWWKRWFDNDTADAGCIAFSLVAALLVYSYPVAAWALLTVPALYVGIGYISGVIVVLRNRL